MSSWGVPLISGIAQWNAFQGGYDQGLLQHSMVCKCKHTIVSKIKKKYIPITTFLQMQQWAVPGKNWQPSITVCLSCFRKKKDGIIKEDNKLDWNSI